MENSISYINNGETFTTSNEYVIEFIYNLTSDNCDETLEDFFGYSEEKREAIKEFIEENNFAIYELDKEHGYRLVDKETVEEYIDKLDTYNHNTRKLSVWDGDFDSLDEVKEKRLPYDKVCAKKEAKEFIKEMQLDGYEDLSDLAKEVVKEWFRWNERYYDSNSDSIYTMEELEREYEEYGQYSGKEYSGTFDEFMEDYRLIDDDFLDGK